MDDANKKFKNKEKERSKPFRWAGYISSGFLILSFTAIYIISFYQLDFWQHYFYRDTLILERNCQYSVANLDRETTSLDFWRDRDLTAIRIPHLNTALNPDSDKLAHDHIYYRCQVTTDEINRSIGIPYLHVSWLFGERSFVYVNHVLRSSQAGQDKPIIPLNHQDLAKDDLIIEIISIGPSGSRLGLRGAAPTVIASGSSQNFRIMGIEASLQQIRQLINLLSMLILALVLGIGWFYGLRSRLLLTTFGYFIYVTLQNFVILFSDFWPWDMIFSYQLNSLIAVGSTVAFILFTMQILQVFSREVTTLSVVNAIFTIIGLALFTAGLDPFWLSEIFVKANFWLPLTLLPPIIFAFLVKLKQSQAEQSDLLSAQKGVIILSLAFIAFIVIDRINPYHMLLSSKLDLLMPLFVGGFLINALRRIEKRYYNEVAIRRRMEFDLDLAEKVQDSLALPKPHSTFGNYIISCHQIKHSKVAGDWIAVRQDAKEVTYVVVSDVTGKGLQAALVVHAVQSLWAERLNEPEFDVEEWIERVNKTLLVLGQRSPHSLTLGLIELHRDHLIYWCMGHVPLFIIARDPEGAAQVRALNARGSILGVTDSISIQSKEYHFEPGYHYDALLGTDGMFPGGSRTRKSDVLSLMNEMQVDVSNAMKLGDDGDDRTLVHVTTSRV